MRAFPRCSRERGSLDLSPDEDTVMPALQKGYSTAACLRSAFEFCDRGSREPLYKESMNEIRRRVVQQCQAHTERKGIKWDPDTLSVKGYPEKTTVRRVLYPWNYHEPDRLSEESLKILNEQLMKVAPKLEVRATGAPYAGWEPCVKESVSALLLDNDRLT